MSEKEIARRVPVWAALAEIFLDTELQTENYRVIAGTITQAGYSGPEARAILHEDVAPAFYGNLIDIAGQWAEWDAAYVRDRVLAKRESWLSRQISRTLFRAYLLKEWRRIEDFLQPTNASRT